MQAKKDIITSTANPRIGRIISLRKPEGRRKSRFFIIEGLKECRLALESSVVIEEACLCPELLEPESEEIILSRIKKKGIALSRVSERVYNRIAFGNRMEGVILIARQPGLSLEELRLKNNPLLVVLEGVEKPGNLGAVIRTADAAGADAVIAADGITDIYNPNVVRASLGALFSVQVLSCGSEKIVAWLKANDIRIAAGVVGAGSSYASVDFRSPCAIALGSEEKGLSRFLRDNADYQVGIPMAGKVDSLNVSVAAGILLFEALRQRLS